MTYKEKFESVSSKYGLSSLEDLTYNSSVVDRFISKWTGFCDVNFENFKIENIPITWVYAINDALEIVKQEFFDFYILQIKLVNGGVKILLAGLSVELDVELSNFCELLFRKELL